MYACSGQWQSGRSSAPLATTSLPLTITTCSSSGTKRKGDASLIVSLTLRFPDFKKIEVPPAPGPAVALLSSLSGKRESSTWTLPMLNRAALIFVFSSLSIIMHFRKQNAQWICSVQLPYTNSSVYNRKLNWLTIVNCVILTIVNKKLMIDSNKS